LKLKREELQTQWRTAIQAQTENYDQKYKAQQYNMGDEVLLSTKNLKAKQPSRKLTHHFIGPYCIEKIIGRQAYKLTLPTAYRIHSVFHVSLLEPYVRQRGANIPRPVLLPVIVDDKEEYVVEELLEKKTEKGQV